MLEARGTNFLAKSVNDDEKVAGKAMNRVRKRFWLTTNGKRKRKKQKQSKQSIERNAETNR